jgi:SAM-dependent methyltransferase
MASNPLHVGEDYHAFITTSARNIRARARFQRLASAVLAPGGTVLDFGAGTGIDALLYADRGHRVQVYEPDPSMLGYLRNHCAAGIEAGRISEADMVPRIALDAVTANFAVLNLIDDRVALFKRLHGLLKPGGTILLSVLNPYFAGDMKYPWWRHNLGRLLTRGRYSVHGPHGGVHRMTPRTIAREAHPGFRLVKVVPGHPGLIFEPFVFIQLERRP